MRRAITIVAMGVCLLSAKDAVAQRVERTRAMQAIDEAWSQQLRQELSTNKPFPFTPPSETELPNNDFGKTVREGLAIFTNTQVLAKPCVGNGLRCANCHLDAGRRPGAAPMWAAWVKYPQFRRKNDKVNTIALRIQGCFRYSMNGTPPPQDSEIMTALMSYLFWLARDAPTGAKLEGAGFPAIHAAAQPPNIERGQLVFAQKCAVCHNTSGQGRKVAGSDSYQFPPLWGPQSFNWGAGMASVDAAAAFIKANMPFGLHNALSDQEAWDVAMYINSRPRPQDPRFTGDVAETKARYHSGRWSLYGTQQEDVMLGDPAAYPLKAVPAE